MIDRRGFLGRIMSGATAIAIKGKTPGTIGDGRLPWGGNEVAEMTEQPSVRDPSSLARMVLERGFNRARDREEDKRHYRIGGFDADLLSLQSVSATAKSRMQYKRDRTARHRLERSRVKLWPGSNKAYDGFY